jgi:hypothetical protein
VALPLHGPVATTVGSVRPLRSICIPLMSNTLPRLSSQRQASVSPPSGTAIEHPAAAASLRLPGKGSSSSTAPSRMRAGRKGDHRRAAAVRWSRGLMMMAGGAITAAIVAGTWRRAWWWPPASGLAAGGRRPSCAVCCRRPAAGWQAARFVKLELQYCGVSQCTFLSFFLSFFVSTGRLIRLKQSAYELVRSVAA